MKTKITLGVSLLLAGITGGLALFSVSYFQRQLRENLAAQQFALISSIAGHIDDNLVAAQKELLEIARKVPPDMLSDALRAQGFLDSQADHKTTFDNTIVLFSRDGSLIAETPFVPGRRGENLSLRDYFKKTLSSAKPVISEPFFISNRHRHPVVMMTAPLFDSAGKVVGVLAGSLDLTHHNFLGKLAHTTIGKSGYHGAHGATTASGGGGRFLGHFSG